MVESTRIINWGAQHIRCFLGDEKPSSLGYNSETFQQHGVNHGEMTQGPHAKVLLLSFLSCSGHVGTVEKMDVPDLGKPHMAIQGEFADSLISLCISDRPFWPSKSTSLWLNIVNQLAPLDTIQVDGMFIDFSTLSSMLSRGKPFLGIWV